MILLDEITIKLLLANKITYYAYHPFKGTSNGLSYPSHHAIAAVTKVPKTPLLATAGRNHAMIWNKEAELNSGTKIHLGNPVSSGPYVIFYQ